MATDGRSEIVASVNASYLRDPARARERHERTTTFLRARVTSCPTCGAVKWGNATCPTCRAHWPGGDPTLTHKPGAGRKAARG